MMKLEAPWLIWKVWSFEPPIMINVAYFHEPGLLLFTGKSPIMPQSATVPVCHSEFPQKQTFSHSYIIYRIFTNTFFLLI